MNLWSNVIHLRLVLVAACVAALPGCCHSRPGSYVVVVGQSTAIFNPPTSPIELADNRRTDWPVAYLPDVTGEDVQFHEQITDIQGRDFGHASDFLIRRFDSDKFGRTRR